MDTSRNVDEPALLSNAERVARNETFGAGQDVDSSTLDDRAAREKLIQHFLTVRAEHEFPPLTDSQIEETRESFVEALRTTEGRPFPPKVLIYALISNPKIEIIIDIPPREITPGGRTKNLKMEVDALHALQSQVGRDVIKVLEEHAEVNQIRKRPDRIDYLLVPLFEKAEEINYRLQEVEGELAERMKIEEGIQNMCEKINAACSENK